jgi:hypothetical protein
MQDPFYGEMNTSLLPKLRLQRASASMLHFLNLPGNSPVTFHHDMYPPPCPPTKVMTMM